MARTFRAVAYTDGSCVRARPDQHGGIGWGGWAAIVEWGSDGWVLRGSQPMTTNVTMELVAAIEALRSLPDGTGVDLHVDCMTVASVHYRWRNGLPVAKGKPGDWYWAQLRDQFERLHVHVVLVRRRDLLGGHQRAHAFAQHEARKARQARDALPTQARAPLHVASQPPQRAWFLEPDPLAAAAARRTRR